MPLDFPSSPTNGQTYGNWIYSTSKGAWQAKPLTTEKTVVSATAPSSPSVGDQWFNSNDGTLYIYYNDGNTSQWVETRAPITADGYKSPNYVINGGMDIFQRSIGPTAGTGYVTADRWYIYNAAVGTTTTAEETSIVPTGFVGSLKLTQTTTTTEVYIMQSVETSNAELLAGRVVTVSAYVYGTVSTSFRVGLQFDAAVDKTPASGYSSGVTSDAVAVGSSWTRISVTGTVPVGTNTIRVDVRAVNPTLSQPFYITGVQLEEGYVATRFRRNANSIQGELAACQRYYFRKVSPNNTATFGQGNAYSATGAMIYVELPTSMRTVPSGLDTSAVSTLSVGSHVSGATLSAIGLDARYTTTETACLNCTSSGMSGGASWLLQANTTGAYVGFSAEL